MICRACGAESADGMRFCTSCGAKLDADTQMSVVENDQGSLTINEQIRRVQIADDVIQEVFSYLESAEQKKKQSFSPQTSSDNFRIVAIVAGGIILSSLVYSIFAKIPILSLLAFAPLGGMVYLLIQEDKKRKSKVAQIKVEEDSERYHAEEVLNQNAEAIAIFPKNYRYPMATAYMREMFETGRVHTINEALDKFDEYEHRMRMEASQTELMKQMQAQSAAISSAGAAATTAASVGAAANILRLLSGI